MQNNITELVFILDRSGSMTALTEDTIGGFNSLIARQRKEPGTAYVTTVLFDTEYEMIHDRLPLDRVPQMTEREYCPRGCTALLDAVGQTIRHIAGIHRYARPEDVPEHTVFVITTDGLENASHSFTREKVRRMIEHEKEKYGWDFIFLGANIDAVASAESIGIEADRAVDFHADAAGSAVVFEAIDCAMSDIRNACPRTNRWRSKADADFRSRKKGSR